MNGSFDSQSRNFGELLGQYEKRQVVVPQFQRGYSWEKTHVATFWSDIKEFHSRLRATKPSERYFLGPIVILPQSAEIVLLDGQQRLATATILFAVVRDAARELSTTRATDLARDIQRDLVENEEGRYSLRLGEMDEAYFRATVQRDPPIKETPRLRSHNRIRAAKDHLSTQLGELIEGLSPDEATSTLKALRDTVAANVTMVAISVNSEEDAFRIFETLNDRGLRLSVPDLLLNYLMRTAKSDTARQRVRERWSFMLETMGQRDIDRFLRHMWLSKYGDVKARGLFAEIREYLQDQKVDSEGFAETCAEECQDYVAIIDPDEDALGDAYPHVVALAKYLDIQPSLPLLLAGLRCLSRGDFRKLCLLTVAVVVRHAVIADRDPSSLETAFYQAARTIRVQRANGSTSAKALYEAKKLLARINPPDAELQPRFEDLYLNRGEALYLLTSIANTMQSKTREIAIGQANLEHIFALNPQASWGDTSQLDPLTWHIGNLTILGSRLNRHAANSDYPTKARHYYAKSEIKMTSAIPARHSAWTPTEIRKRARSLGPVALKLWRGP